MSPDETNGAQVEDAASEDGRMGRKGHRPFVLHLCRARERRHGHLAAICVMTSELRAAGAILGRVFVVLYFPVIWGMNHHRIHLDQINVRFPGSLLDS